MPLEAFTLAQLAEAAGMSVQDVRFYRDSGLLPPAIRHRSRHDDFGFRAEHLERLRFIQRALAYGFTLEDVAHFVDGHALVTCNDVYRISLDRLEELRRTGNPKTADLEKLIASCSRKGSRNDCEILAELAERAPKRGLIF